MADLDATNAEAETTNAHDGQQPQLAHPTARHDTPRTNEAYVVDDGPPDIDNVRRGYYERASLDGVCYPPPVTRLGTMPSKQTAEAGAVGRANTPSSSENPDARTPTDHNPPPSREVQPHPVQSADGETRQTTSDVSAPTSA